MQKLAEALPIGPDVFFTNRRVQLATLAVRHGVPAIYSFREFAEAGGLMSYGTAIARSASMPAASSRAKNQQTSRSCSLPSSSS